MRWKYFHTKILEKTMNKSILIIAVLLLTITGNANAGSTSKKKPPTTDTLDITATIKSIFTTSDAKKKENKK